MQKLEELSECLKKMSHFLFPFEPNRLFDSQLFSLILNSSDGFTNFMQLRIYEYFMKQSLSIFSYVLLMQITKLICVEKKM